MTRPDDLLVERASVPRWRRPVAREDLPGPVVAAGSVLGRTVLTTGLSLALSVGVAAGCRLASSLDSPAPARTGPACSVPASSATRSPLVPSPAPSPVPTVIWVVPS